MSTRATGTFDVKLSPQPEAEESTGPSVARLRINKEFSGELEGVSKGQMLSIGTLIAGSAGYVAIEQVTGSLNGRRGSFALQHSGILNRGEGQLSINVVPDSGTEELEGLSGTMKIIIQDGKHLYEFDYTMAPG